MIPATVITLLEAKLGSRFLSIQPARGGCIANASRIETEKGSFFAKWGSGDVADSIEAEADGLKSLGSAQTSLTVPKIRSFLAGAGDQPAAIIMEWLERRSPSREDWSALGIGLAELHRNAGRSYGYHRNNLIGRLPQKNDQSTNWVDFFRESRLVPQITMAREQNRWPSVWNRMADHLLDNLDRWIPADPVVSLLHGDLWAGNAMAIAPSGFAILDPAVYYGARETDLAMTELFGGFDREFYRSYSEAYPLRDGYRERKMIYNFYHLVNHLNHFGDGYASEVEACLKYFL